MPCTKDLKIDTSKPVLVTGGTGYVAGVLIRELLEKGVCVHTTVRDPSKKDRLQYLQDEADKSKGTIKFFQADLMTPGSFIEACKECHIVFHTASPYTAVVEDPQKDLIEPAVHGTENVLNACNATPTVKRVVVTSSCAAIYTDAADTDPVNGTNEETWNRTATLDHMPYSLSKTLAEQKAWVMAGSQNQWTLCTINPPGIFGPGLKYHASSASFQQVTTVGSGDPNMAAGVPPMGIAMVDVRDVTAAHIAAAYLPDAKGRHIVCNQSLMFSDIGQAIAKKYGKEYPIAATAMPPFLYSLVWLAAPYTGQGLDRTFVSKNWNVPCVFDNSKSKTELGMEYIPMEQTFQEMYQQLIDNKVVSKKAAVSDDKKKK